MGTLYHQLSRFFNIYNAYLKARRNKKYKQDVIAFSMNLEKNLIKIQEELFYEKYSPGTYRSFYVYEPKKREILALQFKDRVVQHAINNIVEPIFEKSFIYDSYACRTGKGTHKAVNRLSYFLKVAKRNWKDVYCLKGDIKQYFPSINREILKNMIDKKIIDEKMNNLLYIIIDGAPNVKGIPIGNLTSQLFANIYLNSFDHFIKERLKIKYYVRYMDDFIILMPLKYQLRELLLLINDYLIDILQLTLNSKSSIFNYRRGIDFLGYRIWPTHRLLRKRSVKKIKRYLKYCEKNNIPFVERRQIINAWLGHASYANTYNLRQKILK